MPSLRCYNKGCGKEFDPDDNGSDSCQYHPGEPIFHDAKKKWSCCNKYSTDFSEFLSMKGCTFGPHNPEKPAPVVVEKAAPQVNIAPPVQPVAKPIPKAPLPRPSSGSPLKVLAPVVSQSLKTALEALKLKDASGADITNDQGPKSCYNNGCKAVFSMDQKVIPRRVCITLVYRYFMKDVSIGAAVKERRLISKHSWLKKVVLPVDMRGQKRHVILPFIPITISKPDLMFFILERIEAITNGTFITPLTSQCRFDWFQMPDTVTLSVYAKNVLPESADVRCNSVFLTLSFLYDGGKSHFEKSFNLFGLIDPDTSRLNLMATKLEVVMRKAEACSWSALEVKASAPPEEEVRKALN
ncbi:unnamed protein product [Hydatigera taeniaeformis]|uniref:CHORD domain-containing protein n=1 Tax=Hydatigena taeniaeformis TaxID=6205 RepID=A0A0R3WJS7_HYDTA|nr:unnamed protein product [Hydatigera taeniaeformis]